MKLQHILSVVPALGALQEANALEYLVSLKSDVTIQHFMESSISKGKSVKDFFGAKIGKTFSIGSFRGVAVDLSSHDLLDVLRRNPIVSEVAPNILFNAFESDQGYKSKLIHDDKNEYVNVTIPPFPPWHHDGDDVDDEDSCGVNGACHRNKDQYRYGRMRNKKSKYQKNHVDNYNRLDILKRQRGAPRHLARLSRRNPLPYDFSNAEAYKSSFNYYYDRLNMGSNVRAYIIDSGIFGKHSDFEGRVEFGHDFTGEGIGDKNGHGTHVAGVVGSRTFGVAKDVTLVDVKCLNELGQGSLVTVLSAIEYVVDDCNKHKDKKCVANLSLGAVKNSIINKAIQAAVDNGVVMVVAAGNFNMNACWSSPASAPEAITVGAFDDRIDTIAKFSNWGPCVDIFAPGVGIASLARNETTPFVVYSGTSMASPSVAGMAALLLDRGVDEENVRDTLFDMATDNVFQRRTLLFKPKTPNRIVFNGVDKSDDNLESMVYPDLDMDILVEELNSYVVNAKSRNSMKNRFRYFLDNDVSLPFENF
ncbi:Rrt12 protein [Maudiozyma humilis]|uniref:Rrt12 protein n=1 Tax=Maudiozyma humilis TaxID=51915 RepID=A0AAV5RRG9_MAUHU|nr:Rrt12 protein [Kazachstania humilis]